MGLAQTKLHHNVLHENWPKIRRRLETEDGKRWIRTKNPSGDYPLHLACYGGHAPPQAIRALVAAFPEALYAENDLGYRPIELARSNYRTGHPFRRDVIGYLEAYILDGTDPISSGGGGGGDELSLSLSLRGDSPPGGDGDNDDDAPRQRILDSGGASNAARYATSATCVVCLDRPADHVVAPCGHMCLCGDCARKVLTDRRQQHHQQHRRTGGGNAPKTCPVCRSEFDSIIRVYAPILGAATTPAAAAAAVVTAE